MARTIGALIGVSLLVLVSLPAHAQNSSVAQVDCDNEQSIQAAVDNAPEGGLIQVSGTCSEAVTVVTDRVSITAVGGAMITPPAGFPPAFSVVARGVEIRDFQINASSGSYGIIVSLGGSAHLKGNDLRGVGIRLDGGSTAVLDSNKITDSADIGADIEQNSYARLVDNIISNSSTAGVFIRGSSAALLSGSDITDARFSGVGVVEASSATMGGNTVTDNGDAGVQVDMNSAISLVSFAGGANTIVRNQWGVLCQPSGAVVVAVAQMFGGPTGNAAGNVEVKAGCDVNNFNSVPAFP